MGTLLVAIALFTPEATVAALYYLIHSTLATAALFLVADLVIERRPKAGGNIVPAAPFPQSGLIASLFFLAAIALAGMPPLSGFVGKLLVMDAARSSDLVWWIWAAILITSLIAVVGFARAGSTLFWKFEDGHGQGRATAAAGRHREGLAITATLGIIGGLVLLSVLAEPVNAFLRDTAGQLYAPADYIGAVLRREQG
jgi:multicomponent K+:H+ antiporter subunit D